MNKLTSINPSPPPAIGGAADTAPNPKPLGEKLKNWIKGFPLFWELDYLRRKAYDSPLFDSAVKPLADILAQWPRALLFDTTNRCNAKCVWCPNPDLTNLGLMDMALYRKIIDDYASRGGRIYFGTFGEPLMDKHLRERIEYARGKAAIHSIQILTNGFFLNEKITPALIGNGVIVEVSLDELDKETFEEVKKMSFDVTRDNLIRFLENNDRAARPVPVNIRIKTLKTLQETLDNEFFQTLQSHRCTLQLTPINDNIISNWAGAFDKNAFMDQYRIDPAPSRFNHKRFNLTNTAPCNQLWRRMVVYWDGQVVLCCADMFAKSDLGNLKDRTIEEVWRGPVLTRLREQMIRRKRFSVPLCRNCDIHLSWHDLKNYYDRHGNPLPRHPLPPAGDVP